MLKYKELGWKKLNEDGYYNRKLFFDFSKESGVEWRLTVLPNNEILIEKFSIYYGNSSADAINNYDCNVVFYGKIDSEKDLVKLMSYLQIPIMENSTIKTN